MFTAEEVDELFHKHEAQDARWTFAPRWNSPLKGYRYALTFIPAERRFTLSRQKIEPFVAVEDDELIEVFRSRLSEEEVAACMRAAINPPPEDDIPF